MKILAPLTITDAMILAGTTVAEPAAGETAWVGGAAYVVGDLRIRVSTHRVYRCAVAHSGSTTPPESDTTHWVEEGPTQRWAPFDNYTNTAATGITSIAYVLQTGFANALALYGLVGSTATITVKESPAGAVIFDQSYSLFESAPDWYEYLFIEQKSLTKLVIPGLPIRPGATMTITIAAAPGAAVGVGMIVPGDYRSLLGDSAAFGGTLQGASAEPVTYSYIDTDKFGKTTIVRRHAATSMRATVAMPRSQADTALSVIQDVLDTPCAWVATDAQGYAGLNVFGLGSARVGYDSFGIANIDISVKGMI
jgi:hypothetical protein